MQSGLKSVILKMKALEFFETSINIFRSTKGNIPEDVNLWIQKSCTYLHKKTNKMHPFVCVYPKICILHVSNVYNVHHKEFFISLYMQLFVRIMLVGKEEAEQLVTASMIRTNSCIYSDMKNSLRWTLDTFETCTVQVLGKHIRKGASCWSFYAINYYARSVHFQILARTVKKKNNFPCNVKRCNKFVAVQRLKYCGHMNNTNEFHQSL